uniref:C-type lectin domain-containing protein n=1 Tax=Stegastes partitus TaxID=144197 RepID=A0A3B5A8Z9_9TELE
MELAFLITLLLLHLSYSLHNGSYNKLSTSLNLWFSAFLASYRECSQHNGKPKFVFYSEQKSWESSLELCRDKHTDMAYARTEEENSEIMNMVKTWTGFFGVHNTAWVGVFSDPWIWSDGGKTSFRFWLRGANHGGNCASVAGTGNWNADRCSLGFVEGTRANTE